MIHEVTKDDLWNLLEIAKWDRSTNGIVYTLNEFYLNGLNTMKKGFNKLTLSVIGGIVGLCWGLFK